MIHATWRLIPLNTPAVLRRCPRCNDRQRFSSADKFRVNGSGRRLDVWLIYKCDACDQTWNCTVLSRVTPESIPAPLLQAFTDNDEATAHRYAFDRELLKKNGAELEPHFEHRIEGDALDLDRLPAGEALELHIVPEQPMGHIRLDTLLAQRLALPRRALATAHERGALRVEPDAKDVLQKKLKRAIVVHVDLDALREEVARARATATSAG